MMLRGRDPLANPEPLIRRVYAYVAYRMGDGAEAEDVTSEVFERAVRYRDRYDLNKGEPLPWLLGIARRCVDGALASRPPIVTDQVERADDGDLEEKSLRRLAVRAAVLALDERDQELVSLRYGADLTARQIGEVLGMRTNTVEVALHRALGRLRQELDASESEGIQGRQEFGKARLSTL
jgi:RNA polymerase sigma factor (sigma-70 family)